MDIKDEVRILHHNLCYLRTYGYNGDCLNLTDLQWAMRVGAASWQYRDLLDWLEDALTCHGNYFERDEVDHLWPVLRKSCLMQKFAGIAINPMLYRCKATHKIANNLIQVFLRIDDETKESKHLEITFKYEKHSFDHQRSVAIKKESKECIPPMDYQTANNWWNR